MVLFPFLVCLLVVLPHPFLNEYEIVSLSLCGRILPYVKLQTLNSPTSRVRCFRALGYRRRNHHPGRIGEMRGLRGRRPGRTRSRGGAVGRQVQNHGPRASGSWFVWSLSSFRCVASIRVCRRGDTSIETLLYVCVCVLLVVGGRAPRQVQRLMRFTSGFCCLSARALQCMHACPLRLRG